MKNANSRLLPETYTYTCETYRIQGSVTGLMWDKVSCNCNKIKLFSNTYIDELHSSNHIKHASLTIFTNVCYESSIGTLGAEWFASFSYTNTDNFINHNQKRSGNRKTFHLILAIKTNCYRKESKNRKLSITLKFGHLFLCLLKF